MQQKAAWSAPYPVSEGGGVLATRGNLVFQGRSDGVLAAYRATDGKQLWAFDAGTGIMAPPVTYTVGGVQYLSVLAGWNYIFNAPGNGPVKPGYGRILTFVLGGAAVLSIPPFGHKDPPPVPAMTTDASPQVVHQGGLLFGTHCARCHGINAVAGALPGSSLRQQGDARRDPGYRAGRHPSRDRNAFLPEASECRASARDPGLRRRARTRVGPADGRTA